MNVYREDIVRLKRLFQLAFLRSGLSVKNSPNDRDRVLINTGNEGDIDTWLICDDGGGMMVDQDLLDRHTFAIPLIEIEMTAYGKFDQ